MLLSDMKLLRGRREEITMMELRRHLGDVISQVQMGKTFSITRSGKIVAILTAPELNALELAGEARRLGLR